MKALPVSSALARWCGRRSKVDGKGTMMHKIVVSSAAVVALAVVGIAQSSVSGDGGGGGGDRLYGGGRIAYPYDGIGFKDFSVVAHATDEDSTRVGTLNYGISPRRLTCLRVSGTQAVIGGYFAEGTPFVQYFEDNGPPFPGGTDRATPVFTIETPDELKLMPRGFPRRCPSSAPPAELAHELRNLLAGDLAVVDAP